MTYTCVFVDGIWYFINLMILEKVGLFKKDRLADGGALDKVPGVEIVSHATGNLASKIQKMSNYEVLDAIKLMGVEFFLNLLLKTAKGYEALVWTFTKIGQENVDRLDFRKYEMTIFSGEELNKILLNIIGMTLIDLITGEKLSLKRTMRRIVAQLPIGKEKEAVGYKCPCPNMGTCQGDKKE